MAKPRAKTDTVPKSGKARKGSGGDQTARRDALLLAALPDVPFDGWSTALIARAAAKTGTAPAEAESLFPRGVASLLAHFDDWADRQAEERLLQEDLGALRVRDRIARGVTARLEVLAPYKQAVAAALGRGIDPRLGARMPRRLWQTADRIWWLAGDTATDWNHYSKRALLSGVLASTTLFWLGDTSEGMADTRGFLDRRIDEVLSLGRRIGTLRDFAARAASPFTPRRRTTAV
jgi:ubiquinone biosynthesis protein COQ9